MRRQILKDKDTLLEVDFRAVCENCDFKGVSRDNKELAEQDANNHQQQPGDEDHVLRIETTQSSSVSLEDKDAVFQLQYRAVCENDNFEGPWQTAIEIAKRDANNHQQQPGNEDHVLRIVTNQTSSMRFQGSARTARPAAKRKKTRKPKR